MTSARATCVAAAVALVACHGRGAHAPTTAPTAGLAIAIYAPSASTATGYAVVDERRWIDVGASPSLVIDDLDPDAPLSSLVIEAVDDPDRLHVGACTRETLDRASLSPVTSSLRCAVSGRRGRQLIRLLYVSPSLTYRADHAVEMHDDAHATVSSRFAIETPRWRQRADVTLFDGVPGGEHAPIAVAHGAIELDGSVAVIALPAREVGARLRWIYDGALATSDTPPADELWHRESTGAVFVWLELAGAALAPGALRVAVALPHGARREVVVPADAHAHAVAADADGATLRLPLWADEQLRGTRSRSVVFDNRVGPDRGGTLAEHFDLAVANTGDVAREVWIEEQLRPAHKRAVQRVVPSAPRLHGDRLGSRVEVAPGAIARVGYTVVYTNDR